MPEKKVQNLNPIEKLLTENLFDHVCVIHEKYKLIEICPFYLFVFTIYSSLMYVMVLAINWLLQIAKNI